ncbi:MAG TPA: DUF6282 family protein [Kofleriaceae bacterium]|nr:DUF6282 family protein [Kofleriaceae bacterium]
MSVEGLPDGALDIHVHAAPSHFARWGDAWDLAERCRDAGMRGFVLKCHHGSSVEVAALLARRFPELSIHGGVVLNAFVGGLNPIAVESYLGLGARVVWLPTIHGSFHAERCGCLGGFGFQESPLRRVPEQGLSVLDARGALSPAVRDIVEMCAERGAVLATGHASAAEIRALAAFIGDLRRRPRLLVNHVDFHAPGLTAEEVRALAGDDVWFELAYIAVSELVACATFASTAALIAAVPHARWVLASDSGQAANPPAPQALARYYTGLRAAGVDPRALTRMMTTAPAELLEVAA